MLPDATSRNDDRARLASLLTVSQVLMDAEDPDQVLQRILESGTALFDCEGCSMALADEAGDELVFFAMAGPTDVREFRMGREQGVAGWVLREGRGVIVNDARDDPRFFSGVDDRTGYITRSIMAAPIRQRGRTVGVIEAVNTRLPGGFAEADLAVLEAFGGLAGAALTRARMQAAVRYAGDVYREDVQGRFRLVGGASPAMREAIDLARRVARTASTVLLLGESGTGKEVMARAIHQWSPRAERPFVAVNCVALTPSLLESELFGHEKGAFTGAAARKKGRFELAHGGTLFLDEIGDLAPDLQTKLLRVLQEREFQRVGGSEDIKTDVRVVAATNRDLGEAIAAGRFREDLYYRLNVFAVHLPPLRERPEDVDELVPHFVERYSLEVGRPTLGVSRAARSLLRDYAWPGNVRELSNVIERAVVLSQGPDIEPGDLPPEVRGLRAGPMSRPIQAAAAMVGHDLPLAEGVRAYKVARVEDALERADGSQRKAAELLGLAQSNLSRLMKTLGMR